MGNGPTTATLGEAPGAEIKMRTFKSQADYDQNWADRDFIALFKPEFLGKDDGGRSIFGLHDAFGNPGMARARLTLKEYRAEWSRAGHRPGHPSAGRGFSVWTTPTFSDGRTSTVDESGNSWPFRI